MLEVAVGLRLYISAGGMATFGAIVRDYRAAENKWRGDSIPVWVDAAREMVEALMERVPSSGRKRLLCPFADCAVFPFPYEQRTQLNCVLVDSVGLGRILASGQQSAECLCGLCS